MPALCYSHVPRFLLCFSLSLRHTPQSPFIQNRSLFSFRSIFALSSSLPLSISISEPIRGSHTHTQQGKKGKVTEERRYICMHLKETHKQLNISVCVCVCHIITCRHRLLCTPCSPLSLAHGSVFGYPCRSGYARPIGSILPKWDSLTPPLSLTISLTFCFSLYASDSVAISRRLPLVHSLFQIALSPPPLPTHTRPNTEKWDCIPLVAIVIVISLASTV